jgi:hypothetical protein
MEVHQKDDGNAGFFGIAQRKKKRDEKASDDR